MSRVARDFPWHLFALAIVVAGLSILAPLTWWQAGGNRSPLFAKRLLPAAAPRWAVTLGRPDAVVIPKRQLPEPQVAAIGPLIADEIFLDPSVKETPALPAGGPELSDQALQNEPPGELRLSATIVRPPQVPLPEPKEIEALRQPADAPEASPFAIPESAFPANRAWPHPTALMEQLHGAGLAAPGANAWAEQAIAGITRLVACPSLADPAVLNELANLRRIADEAKGLAKSAGDDQGRSKILRAGYALVRRLVIWDAVHALAASGHLEAAPIVDQRAWKAALARVDSMLVATGGAAAWRKYLLIDRAKADFDSSSCSPIEQRQLARDILHRLHSTQLSREQEKFLCTPPFEALDDQLQARAAETPDLAALLRAMERREHEDSSPAGRALAMEFDLLRWSPDAGVRELAETINAYYRNANVRVALSKGLVNRMIPQQTPRLEAVEDMILGASVSGQSQTNTKVQVTLVPDEQRWHIALEATGQVATDTSSSKGPATFYQRGWSQFRARKKLTVDRRGIRLFSSEADADSNTDLNDLETEFDGIPLLGGLIRAIARDRYDESQPEAKMEVEGRIVYRATSQLDSEVAAQLEKAKQDFQTKVIKPFQDLNLEPTPVNMETTPDRLIARYRIAARDEVSAHTPRPQAPSDSMLSVQIHESAMNNVLEQLHLSGRRVELRELFKEMNARFNAGKKIEVPEDMPENVYVTFADEDAIRVDCQDGRVRLTIHIKELAQEGTRNRWTRFTVHAYYAPSADQLDANLYRDGIIELIGDNRPLPLGQRTGLTAIFARVLSRNRKLHIINQQISNSPHLRDQQVTQFVIHDGWIGVALGPQAPGRRAAMHPRPDLTRE